MKNEKYIKIKIKKGKKNKKSKIYIYIYMVQNMYSLKVNYFSLTCFEIESCNFYSLFFFFFSFFFKSLA